MILLMSEFKPETKSKKPSVTCLAANKSSNSKRYSWMTYQQMLGYEEKAKGRMHQEYKKMDPLQPEPQHPSLQQLLLDVERDDR